MLNQTLSAGAQVRQQSPLEQATDLLRASHERMAHQVERAEIVFRPALRGSSPPVELSNSKNNIEPSYGELVDMINSAARFMHSTADRLSEINERSALF